MITNKILRRLVRWDIETGAEAEAILRKFYQPMAPFDVDACKKEYATARKPGKEGEDFVAKKRAEHEQAMKDHWENFKNKAALDPVTGRIFSIGIREDGKNTILTATTDAEEKSIIMKFLALCVEVMAAGGIMEGFNTDGFDLPFVFRRALKYRVNPHVLRSGRYWVQTFRDLLVVWQAGDRKEYISLDKLAEFLGTEHRKNGDGAFFAELFAKEPEKAIEYLCNDLLMTEEVGVALVPPPEVAAAGTEKPDDVPFADAA